jgi:hypothetical protein
VLYKHRRYAAGLGKPFPAIGKSTAQKSLSISTGDEYRLNAIRLTAADGNR